MISPTVSILPATPFSWTKIELPPDLPMPVFTSNDAWNAKRVGALAIYCSDGRWGEAFDEFCHRSLGIPRYDRFAVPGGPAWIAQDGGETHLLAAAHEQIDFLVRHHSLERIVLITHWGCAFYSDEGKRSARDAWPDQLTEIQAAATNLRLWFEGVRVESYLAMQLDGRISFHEVGTGLDATKRRAEKSIAISPAVEKWQKPAPRLQPAI